MDTVFFDLDGTLTDPKPRITHSIRYALRKLEHPAIPSEGELTWAGASQVCATPEEIPGCIS